MGLFDLFKSDEDKKAEAAFQQLHEMVFPGGAKHVERDCRRVDALTGGKIPRDRLNGFVSGCKCLIYISQDLDNEDRFVESFVTRSGGKISRQEAYDLFVYFDGEGRSYDMAMTMARKFGGDLSAVEDGLFGETDRIYAHGTYNDEIPGSYGEYGRSETNPVPTTSIRASNAYLQKLRYGGRPVESNRLGSTSSPITPGSVDMYRITGGGREVGTVFICPYHRKNSRKAPKGFSLA